MPQTQGTTRIPKNQRSTKALPEPTVLPGSARIAAPKPTMINIRNAPTPSATG